MSILSVLVNISPVSLDDSLISRFVATLCFLNNSLKM